MFEAAAGTLDRAMQIFYDQKVHSFWNRLPAVGSRYPTSNTAAISNCNCNGNCICNPHHDRDRNPDRDLHHHSNFNPNKLPSAGLSLCREPKSYVICQLCMPPALWPYIAYIYASPNPNPNPDPNPNPHLEAEYLRAYRGIGPELASGHTDTSP